MRTTKRSVVAALLLACAATSPAYADAGAFVLVSQSRSFWTDPITFARGVDGRSNDYDVPEFANASDPTYFGSFDTHLNFGTMAVTPDGTATAKAHVSLDLTTLIGTQVISFEAKSAASALFETTAPGLTFGSATGESSAGMGVNFNVLEPLVVTLAMHGSPAHGNGSYSFDLTRGSTVVWTDESVLDPKTKQQTRTFTEVVTLQPGSYHVGAGVGSFARIGDPAAEASGGFTLSVGIASAAPEPQSWLLLVAGLAALAFVRRRASG
jgi:hypothetical protein